MADSDPGRPKPSTQQLKCSFCNKEQADVRKLIAGPTVFICDECVDVCVDIIADDDRSHWQSQYSPSDQVRRKISRSAAQEADACGLCGKPVVFAEALPIENRGVLCAECADAVEDALAQGRPAS